jgi:flagellar biosynthesis GTPase FlhF
MTKVSLKSLKPNPTRVFAVDPIDESRIPDLIKSIKDDGFWGGVVCRRTKNGPEIACGHQRVHAAIAAGIEEADIFFRDDMDDAAMIRVYARENATHRANMGTAVTGSIAAAARFLIKRSLVGESADFRRFEGARKLVDGIGRDTILEFLEGVPGINQNVVMQQLANLKASGHYRRIVEEVQAEIEAEHKAEIEALKRRQEAKRQADEDARIAATRRKAAEERRKAAKAAAKKAKEDKEKAAAAAREKAAADQAAEEERRAKEAKAKADAELEASAQTQAMMEKTKATTDKAKADGDPTFDYSGVAKHFKNPSHVDAFRKFATGEGAAPYLPVDQQAALAESLAKLAAHRGAELTGRFIQENFMSLLLGAKTAERRISKEEKEDLTRKDWSAKALAYQDEIGRHGRGLLKNAVLLAEHDQKRPEGTPLPMQGQFRKGIENLKRAVALIEKVGLA